ncbi:uncharacterized protein [Amphiura filiformis]|uniref:uncharacterized protein n=1 Tax=Amphiura filiformis TaxID=82378 RepID=UPI003B21F6C1
MDLGKAAFYKAATTNLFHHNQVFHKDYGLVWHNGKAVFLSDLQFCHEENQPKPASPALTLGQFNDDVIGVCWSRDESAGANTSSGDNDDVISHLCVQHLDHITVWAVSGRNIDLKCQKQAELQVKSLSQGCLWHPRESILCVLSHTELHVYNAQSTSWDTIQCDGKVTAGCWGRDGSKFILAFGSEMKVLEFNPQTLSLEYKEEDRNNKAGTNIQSFQNYTSIKAMTPVTNELVAIVTDLPLDHLIYKNHQDQPLSTVMMKTHQKPSADEYRQTSEFSLIIPRDLIVQNPIVDMFKEHKPCDSLIYNVSKTDEETPKTSISQEEERSPSADTPGEKVDQILNLMKRMDAMPNERGSSLQLERKTSPAVLRNELESAMTDAVRSGPIDITEMMNEIQGADFNSSVNKLNGHNANLNADGTSASSKNGRSIPVRSHSNGNHGHNAARSMHFANHSSRYEVTSLIESEIKGRQTGPLDVTALLAAKMAANSLDGTQGQEVFKEDFVNGRGVKREVGSGDSSQTLADDIIDLTGLKADKMEGDTSQTVEIRQKTDSPDAAKLTLLRMSAFNELSVMTSVDLPGILMPDLLHFQESSQCFVVGTKTQRQLLVYRLYNNKLEPAKENIMLPDLHRPLGVCDIPGCPTDILVLAGESQPSDGAFLTISSKTEMNLKLIKYDLHLKVQSGFAENGSAANRFANSHVPSDVTDLSKIQMSSSKATGQHDVSQSATPENTEMSTQPNESHHGHTMARTSAASGHSTVNKPWTSSPRFKNRIQGGWRSYSYETGQMASRRGQNQQVESSSSSERGASKYPYPEDADVVHLVCKGAENEATLVLKTFLLNEQMLKLQAIKNAFGLNSVEMKIRDSWVVLTEDSSGYVPLRFSPNSSHTIKENHKLHNL